MIEVYSDYHTPTLVYASTPEGWYIFPSVHGGWAARRPWHPSESVAKRMAQPANRTTFFGLGWLAEQTYGIPRNQVAVMTPDEYEAYCVTD